jgi:hypothetical protein
MTNIQKWGDISAWTDGLFGTNATQLQSLAGSAGVLGSGILTNSGEDLLMDCSFQSGSSITAPTSFFPWVSLYLFPLLADGSTYVDDGPNGEGVVTSWPSPNFMVSIVQTRTTNGNLNVMFRGIILPPGQFKLYFLNVAMTGASTLPASGLKFLYRTYSQTNYG